MDTIYAGPTESVTLPEGIKPEMVEEVTFSTFGYLIRTTDGRQVRDGRTAKVPSMPLKRKYR